MSASMPRFTYGDGKTSVANATRYGVPAAGGYALAEQEDASAKTEPLPELPYDIAADALDGATEEQARIILSKMDDRERIHTAVHLGGEAAAKRERHSLFTKRKIDEYYKLVYPEGDSGALAHQLGGPSSLELIEELQKTPKGKKDLKDIWTRAQFARLTKELTPEYLAYEAEAIGSDTAILAANWRRLVEDTYGGTGTAILNIGADFGAAAVQFGAIGALGAVRTVLTLSRSNEPADEEAFAIAKDNEDKNAIAEAQQRNPYRLVTAEDLPDKEKFLPVIFAPGVETPTDVLIKRLENLMDDIDRALYRPEARSGSFIYDNASRIAKGLGTVGASIAITAANPYVGVAVMFGASKEEMRKRILADGGDPESAERISTVYALASTTVEFINIDRFLRLNRGLSPMASFFWNSVAVSAAVNTGEEMTQSILGDIALEFDRSTRDGYGGFDPIGFLENSLNRALEAGVDSLPVGGIAGFTMGGPFNTAQRRVWCTKFRQFVNGGAKLLGKAPDIKTRPVEMRRVLDDIIQKNGAPKTGFIKAEDLSKQYAGDDTGLIRALRDLGIPPERFASALKDGSIIEVDTAGVIQHAASVEDGAEIQDLVRPDSDAPTLKVIGEEVAALQEVVDELKALRDGKHILPEQFDRFREQLVEAGGKHEAARVTAAIRYAQAKVEGAKQGMTPEEFFASETGKAFREDSIARAQRGEEAFLALENERAKREDTVLREGEEQDTINESLGNLETRDSYIKQIGQIDRKLDVNLPLSDQAAQAFIARNQQKMQSRETMNDRDVADVLNVLHPPWTWEEIIKKYEKRGYSGDALYQEIIKASMRTNKKINDIFDL